MTALNQQVQENRPLTREGWLLAAVNELRTDFRRAGGTIPEALRISVGWPKGARGRGRAIGQCFPSTMCKDGQTALFVSPELEDPVEFLEVATHELVHACDDCKSGHKGEFKRLATAIGLEGKMTATVAGDALRERLTRLAAELGPLPHAALDYSGRKKPGSRLLKAECSGCGYVIRVTAKWAEQGLPICPTCDTEFDLA